MTKVVCNASPIIGLAVLGKLNFLWELFEVVIPAEVYESSFLTANFGLDVGYKSTRYKI
jgi:predicted nucleic acid-binding protein